MQSVDAGALPLAGGGRRCVRGLGTSGRRCLVQTFAAP